MNRIIIFIFAIFYGHVFYGQQTEAIRLNQVGFYTEGPKQAIVLSPNATGAFFITTVNKKDTVYKGNLGAEKASEFSSAKTRLIDFTSLRKKGEFVIIVEGVGFSWPFQIREAVMHDVNKAVIKAYYYQRSGMAIDKLYAGKWNRKEGHPDTSVLIHPSAANVMRPSGTVISTPGGWYDAGDYNKYIVNSGITMGTLLSAYEDYSKYLDHLKLDIPESSDALPDLLNETLYNLRWMLTMQDPHDGGVYHKCTNAVFDAMIMPDAAIKTRYVVQKSTAATLDFAAVAAQAARIFKKFGKQLPGLSDSCLYSAQKAWQWAQVNNNVIYDQQAINKKYKPAITTGEYGDRNVNDEWMWVAAELYASTLNDIYLDVLKQRMHTGIAIPSWNNVTMLAYYTLIRMEKKLPASTMTMINAMKDSVVNLADKLLAHIPANAFGTVMGQNKNDFMWGSNSQAANEGIVLVNAYLISKKRKYLEGALSNVDYIFGRNATGYCFVTGIGSRSPMHPHHRPSIADGIADPVPGWLVAGPNPGQQDKCHYQFNEPETSYEDSDCAYASNEVAINWNAPLVYLITAVENLE